jgi:HAT1-interacting factor 1
MASADTSAPVPTKDKLKELTTAANLQYSLKNYTAAADIFSHATELQAELNGEMAHENAELLYEYGRCLYKVAVGKSDVLGGKVASDEKPDKSKKGIKDQVEQGQGSSSGAQAKPPGAKSEDAVENKPFFQLTGDENWTDSEEEEEEAQGEEEAEDDDFATAYEILDFARVLFERQLEALASQVSSMEQESKGKGKAPSIPDETPETRHLKERLADTHDLQAEISLENERFTDAISDSRAAIALRKELYPQESSLIAEGHYKLSLSLEFASVSAVRDAQREQESGGSADVKPQNAEIDIALREEAAVEMEAAIASLSLRLEKEEAELASLSGNKKEEHNKSIIDVKEMLEEMNMRVRMDLCGSESLQLILPSFMTSALLPLRKRQTHLQISLAPIQLSSKVYWAISSVLIQQPKKRDLTKRQRALMTSRAWLGTRRSPQKKRERKSTGKARGS